MKDEIKLTLARLKKMQLRIVELENENEMLKKRVISLEDDKIKPHVRNDGHLRIETKDSRIIK